MSEEPQYSLSFPISQPVHVASGHLVCALGLGPQPYWWRREEQLTPFLLSTVQCIQNKPLYFADRLYDSMKVRAAACMVRVSRRLFFFCAPN